MPGEGWVETGKGRKDARKTVGGPSECPKVAHRHSLAIFHRRLGYRKGLRSGNQFCPFYRREKFAVR